MKWELFKRQLRSEMSDHMSDVNPDEIWKGIEADVDAINASKKGKKRAALLFFLGFSVCISSVFYFTNLETSRTISKNEINQPNRTESLVKTKEQNFELYKTETKSFVKAAAQSKKSSSKEMNRKVGLAEELNQLKQATRKSIEKDVYSQSKSNLVNEIISTKAIPTLDNLSNTSLMALSNKSKKQNIAEPNAYNSSKVSKISSYSLLPVTKLNKANPIDILPKNLGKVRKQHSFDLDIEKKNRKGFQFSVGLIAGASKPIKILSEKNSEKELLDFRSNSETPIIENYYGAEIIAKHASGLEIITGISKNTVIEKFEHEYSYEIRNVINETINVNGEIYSVNKGTQIYRTYLKKKYFNQQSYLQIPVMLGYKASVGRLGIGVRSGLYTSLLLSSKGKLAGIDGEDIHLDQQSDNRFDSKFGLGFILGLSIDVNLSKHLAFNMAPTFRYHIIDHTSANNPLSQKYMLIGGQVGLSYKFNK